MRRQLRKRPHQTQAVQALQYKARRQETRVFGMIRSAKMNPYTSVAVIADHLPRLWEINRDRRWLILCVFCKVGFPEPRTHFPQRSTTRIRFFVTNNLYREFRKAHP